jgi:hypothetical protein
MRAAKLRGRRMKEVGEEGEGRRKEGRGGRRDVGRRRRDVEVSNLQSPSPGNDKCKPKGNKKRTFKRDTPGSSKKKKSSLLPKLPSKKKKTLP